MDYLCRDLRLKSSMLHQLRIKDVLFQRSDGNWKQYTERILVCDALSYFKTPLPFITELEILCKTLFRVQGLGVENLEVEEFMC